MNLEFSRQIFDKSSDSKLNENPSSESRIVTYGGGGTYRRTNITKLIVAFRNISHAPKNSKIKKISSICAEFFSVRE